MKHTKCSWCNKLLPGEELQQSILQSSQNKIAYRMCSDKCLKQTEQFVRYIDSYGKRFLIMIGVVVFAYIILTVLSILLKSDIMFAVALAVPTFLLGVTMYKYPFATPETVEYWGFRKSIRVVRMLGIIIMIAGFTALIIAGFMLL